MRSSSTTGILLVLGAAVLWGTTGTAQSFAKGALSPYWVGALRLAIATLFFVAYAAGRLGGRRLTRGLAQLSWPWAILAGACMAGYNLAFFAGVRATGVAVGTALALGSGPVWAGFLQLAVTRKVPSPGWWLGTALAVAGGVLLVVGRGGALRADAVGIARWLGSGLSYAIYALVSKRLVHHGDPATVTLAVFGMGAVIALPVAWAWVGSPDIAARGWAVVAFLGVAATGVAYLLFNTGLRGIAAASAVSLALMEPLTAFLLAIVVVGEHPAALAFVGLACVLAGLALVIRAELRGH
jgi:DME family drug/metabolite transporter